MHSACADGAIFYLIIISTQYMRQLYDNIPQQSKEAHIILAIKAIHKDPKMSIQRAIQTYKVSETTLLTVR